MEFCWVYPDVVLYTDKVKTNFQTKGLKTIKEDKMQEDTKIGLSPIFKSFRAKLSNQFQW